MGEVTSATILRPDGSITQAAHAEAVTYGSEQGLVELGYDYQQSLLPRPPSPTGIWRWAKLLPLEEGPVGYPLTVGSTPLVASGRLRSLLGVPHLYLKDETRGPSGSNKDRATALVCEHALRRGTTTVTSASTGNVAVSLAVGAAAACLRAVIFVPAQTSETKLQVMLAAGATVVRVARGYEAAFRLSRSAASTFGWFDRNTGVNPLTIEAKKTVAFEIWEDLGRRVPDAVLAPIGDGPTLSALAKGFRELMRCGASHRLPRLVGVQAEGCQPVKRSWDTGDAIRPVEPNTVADGIAVGSPVSAATVLRDVRESGGGLVAVSDEAMLEAVSTLASRAGLIAEPAGAAAFAGLGPALAARLLHSDETVVALVTGSGLKTPHFLAPAGAILEVQGKLEELEPVLDSTARAGS